ncbi:hypothetical protein PIB30_036931 [Stylosanthes scabra]|uniref:CCHC-type domain-containing protein n=1 Tax=Stylosanthes scabra TaxID=79078 RepID=A0ABU6TDT1_9FABA|nr:hypothetical protein [Stylosanthes scabra]
MANNGVYQSNILTLHQTCWTPTGAPKTLPPPIKRPAHRPKKKRRVDGVAEREMHANKVRMTFEVTCNRCGQNGHYYKTCKNPPLDPNWKPMTKKERRAASGNSAATSSKAKHRNKEVAPQETSHQEVVNDAANVVNKQSVDPVERAKKNKKKIPKPGVRVKPPKKKAQTEEIPISQGAPNTEEHGNGSQNLGQDVPPQPINSLGHQATQRMKQPIIRPQIPPPTTPNSIIATIGPTLKNNTQSYGPRGVSAETMAATSSGTAARLFRYMPTPGFKPPRQK